MRRTRALATASTVTSLALIGTLGTLAVFQSRETIDAVHRVQHTFDVLAGIEKLRSHLLTVETCQRGYLLTGDEAYLNPYDRDLGLISGDIDRLRSLTTDNPAQQERLAKLVPLTTTKLAEMAATISTRREHGFASALHIVEMDIGKHTMEGIQDLLDAMRDSERILLNERLETRDASARYETLTAGILAGAAFVILGGAIVALYRTSRRREEAEKKVQESEARLPYHFTKYLRCSNRRGPFKRRRVHESGGSSSNGLAGARRSRSASRPGVSNRQ